MARLQAENPLIVVKDPPFYIPEFELKMAWTPLLHHHPAHRWLRQLIIFVARQVVAEEEQAERERLAEELALRERLGGEMG